MSAFIFMSAGIVNKYTNTNTNNIHIRIFSLSYKMSLTHLYIDSNTHSETMPPSPYNVVFLNLSQ